MQGKALFRQLTLKQRDWDEPLPADREAEWSKWTDSLTVLENLHIHRPFVPISLSLTQTRELYVFSDSSTLAIAAVAYLRVIDTDGQCHVGFIMGKSKLAPTAANTVPRLELCAVELAHTVIKKSDIEFHAVNFYPDSKIVLGYIHNSTRRFYVYVANRVALIRKVTKNDQWHHVATDQNPADNGTRFVLASQLQYTTWLTAPQFLQTNTGDINKRVSFDLVLPTADMEIRPQVTT